jgi:hypothetical protein
MYVPTAARRCGRLRWAPRFAVPWSETFPEIRRWRNRSPPTWSRTCPHPLASHTGRARVGSRPFPLRSSPSPRARLPADTPTFERRNHRRPSRPFSRRGQFGQILHGASGEHRAPLCEVASPPTRRPGGYSTIAVMPSIAAPARACSVVGQVAGGHRTVLGQPRQPRLAVGERLGGGMAAGHAPLAYRWSWAAQRVTFLPCCARRPTTPTRGTREARRAPRPCFRAAAATSDNGGYVRSDRAGRPVPIIGPSPCP